MVTKRTMPEAAAKQLLGEIFGDQPHELTRPFAHWLAASKSFATFAQTYLAKIRKKVRTAQDGEARRDLLCELWTAYLLLQEPRFAVEYEPGGTQRGRSPDFAVAYRTHLAFHVEVTRLRSLQLGSHSISVGEGGPDALLPRVEARRLADVIVDKAGQLSPRTPNALLIWVSDDVVQEADLRQLLAGLKQKVEQRDAGVLARYGVQSPAEFMRNYQRLSLVVVQDLPPASGIKAPCIWINPDAKYPLPEKLRNLLMDRLQTAPSPGFPLAE